jgi:DNA-binding protein
MPRIIDGPDAALFETISVKKRVWDGKLAALEAINAKARELRITAKGSRIGHALDEIIRLSGGAK